MRKTYPADGPYTTDLPPHTPPPTDPPTPPHGNPQEPDGPVVPHEPPPPLIDVSPPHININLPDIDIDLPGIHIGLPGADGGLIDIDIGGGGGLLNLGDDLPLLDLNGDGEALINVELPIGLEGSIGLGGGEGGNLGLISINSDADGLINLDLQGSDGTHELGNLINLLGSGGDGLLGGLMPDDAYDGVVPLVCDLPSALDMTLDHVTTVTSLFDIPLLDAFPIEGIHG
jgi:hypothetical protein